MIDITDEDIDLLQEETGLAFDDTRRECLKSYKDVQACPGSGKTTLVAAKLILLAKKWTHNYQGICVLSHTNVAKDEITKRLQDHPYGVKLLKYPHFIGTIQAFVDKFLAIPYLHSKQLYIKDFIDKDSYSNIFRKSVSNNYYFRKNPDFDFSKIQYEFKNNEIKLSIPLKDETTESYKTLTNLKKILRSNGLHLYHEMFEYGKASLHSNSSIEKFLRKRFPIVIIDEMQDTNKQQDELLNSIFTSQACKFQKFGDPDQAIYDSMNDNLPNESYNNQTDLLTIELSHRFSNDIANLVTGLSYNKLTLNTVLSSKDNPQHTIYLVDKATREQVIPTFAKLCCECIPNDNTLPIKAVGAVGKIKKGEKDLTIWHYFPSFTKEKANNHNLNFDKLILYILKAKQLKDSHMKEPYQIVMKGIVKFCELASIELNQNSTSSLNTWFKQTNKIIDYNRWFLSVMQTDVITESFWQSKIIELLSLFNIEPTPEVTEFFKYTQQDMDDSTNTSNVYSYTAEDKTIIVEVSTIHGVKGETHAATIVLETKNKSYDIEKMMDHLLSSTRRKLSGNQEKFMKQLFVATTRPKYLVCLAMDKSRLPSSKLELAIEKGWKIVDLTNHNIG